MAGDDAAGDRPRCRAIKLSADELNGLLKLAGVVNGVMLA